MPLFTDTSPNTTSSDPHSSSSAEWSHVTPRIWRLSNNTAGSHHCENVWDLSQKFGAGANDEIFGKGSKFDNSSIHNDFRERSWLWSWCWQSLTCVCVCVCVTIVFPSLALWKSCGKYTLNAHIKLWQQTELPMSVCMSYDATGNVSFFQFNDFANRPILLLLSAHLTSALIQQGSHTPASQHLKQNPSCPSSNCWDLVAFQQQFLCFSADKGSPANPSRQINLLVPVLPEESLGVP
jgi:hypothetical protein